VSVDGVDRFKSIEGAHVARRVDDDGEFEPLSGPIALRQRRLAQFVIPEADHAVPVEAVECFFDLRAEALGIGMPFTYRSGEEIKAGDRVLFHGEPGEIEFVAAALSGDAAMDWYVEEYGAGIMVVEPKFFGRAFVHTGEDLRFVSRVKTGA
jgi:hypothetical protein